MSIAQPSVNQVANLYQGNPGALNARIQQEQQGKKGLPPDLTKLMALNIDVNEQDAAKRQQAMAALQSMQQQGGGEPPTVAQTIQQQAMQKAQLMQQQMQQMQPKPQGLMALLQQRAMPQAPENEQRPNRQPSGIDELSSNVGEHFDGGGIVAFSKPTAENNNSLVDDPEKDKYETPYDRRNRLLNESGERFGKPSKQSIEEADIPKPENVEFTPEGVPRSRSEQAEIMARNNAIAAVQENARKLAAMRDLRLQQMQNPQISPEYLQQTKEFYKPRRTPSGIENLVVQQGATYPESGSAATPEATNKPPVANAPPATNKPSIANLVTNQQPPKPAAPAAPAAPTAPAAAAPAPSTALDKFLESALRDPAAMRDESIRRMAQAYGEPDTAAQEKYIKQLDESRARFAEPEDFAGRLSRWARNTAGAGGRTSLETGSKGAAATYAEQQANAQRNMEILKELMGESSKVADIKRNYKKELFGFGEKTYDDAYKVGMDAAKELKLDARQAQLFAHQSAENALQRANALKVAGMPGADQREFMSIAQSWLSKPENKGKTLDDAFVFFANAKQGYKPEQARAGLIERYANDWNKMDIMEKSNLKKEGVNNVDDYVNRMLKLTEQTKSGATTAPTSGTVPAVGTVMQGFRFKGGNPADKNNWEKV